MTSLMCVTEPGLRFSAAPPDRPAELELTVLRPNRLHVRIDAQSIAARFGFEVDHPSISLVADGDTGKIKAASYLVPPNEKLNNLRLHGTMTDLPLHHEHPRQVCFHDERADDLADYIGHFIGAGSLHTAGVGYALQRFDHRLLSNFLIAQVDYEPDLGFSYFDAGMIFVVAPTDGTLVLSSRWKAFGQFL